MANHVLMVAVVALAVLVVAVEQVQEVLLTMCRLTPLAMSMKV